MRVSKAKRMLSVMSLVLTVAAAGRASAQCRICDPFLHCVESRPGALVCIEGPLSCAMVMPCLGGGGGKAFDGAEDEDLTTWTLFDATAAPGSGRATVRPGASALALGDEARSGLGGTTGAGTLADAALAHGREWSIVLVDAAGDGFALKRAVEGARVRLEVRDVRGDVTGAMVASEALDPRDQLSVPVRVEGRDRVLVLQAGAVRGPESVFELSRLRQGLRVAGRVLPRRQEPLLRAHAR